jgi:beta-lactamase superfamily II metal-dependent hydrolase
MVKPVGLRIRMYQVGFGDCFLLSFEYRKPRPDRHVLIDFGTTHPVPRGRPLHGIAELIRDHSGGHLDAVVLSHRHKDHLSAFADKDIAALLTQNGTPSVVVRPWTEDPEAPAKAGAASRRFVKSLNAANRFADRLAARVVAAAEASPRSLNADLWRAADDQLKNAKAVKQLEEWAKAGKAAYVHYGQPSGLEAVLPGVKVRVLGPPTIEQHREVEGKPAQDHEEFWIHYGRLLSGDSLDLMLASAPQRSGAPDEDAVELDEDAGQAEQDAVDRQPHATGATGAIGAVGALGPTRWLIDRLGRQQANSFLRIVRRMDNALNNTSLILLFEVPCTGGAKRLLFGGDAQVENWEYALRVAPDTAENQKLLRKVDLYKVGHHGSRNATPKNWLFGLWLEPGTIDREMVALMSTNKGAGHGDTEQTRVPQGNLVRALKERMTLYSTEDLGAGRDFLELEVDLSKRGAGFVEM